MNKRKFLLLALVALAVLLSSCAASKPVSPDYLYKNDFISVHPPSSPGWQLISSSPSGIEFARKGETSGESFAAQVFMFQLKNTQDNDDFVSFIKRGYEADPDSDRFKPIKSEFVYSEQRSYPCVSVESIIEDKQAHTSTFGREKLLLQATSLYCRHPVQPEVCFMITYSHRGRSMYPNLNSEATEFINGVQLLGH